MKERDELRVLITKSKNTRDLRHCNLAKSRAELEERDREAMQPLLDQLKQIDLNKKFDGDTSNCIKCPETDCQTWTKNRHGLIVHYGRMHKGSYRCR